LYNSRSLSKSSGIKSLLIVLASILFLTIISEVAPSKAEEVNEDEAMRNLVQQMIQIGTTQYESGKYVQAEKTLLMTQAYLEYLTAEERNNLSRLLEKTQLATVERKRALEHKQTASELFGQGELLKAEAHLEKIKHSRFLTEQEREQSVQLLNKIESQKINSTSSLKGGREKLAEEPKIGTKQTNDRKKQVAETYYRSMRLYRSGQIEKAREGFLEVVNSGLIPPAMVKTLQGYLTQIAENNGREMKDKQQEAEPPRYGGGLRRDEQPSGSAPQPPVTPEITELEVIEPEAAKPVTEQGGYIEVIKRNRNIQRSYTKAVVNDAIAKARNYLSQGQFDKAEEVVENAERIVNQNQLHLGDDLNAQYNNDLKQMNDEITTLKQEQMHYLEQQKREDVIEVQRQYREQTEADRQKRIQTLMENAKAYTKQQRYEAAVGQLESLLALDPQNDEALTLRDALEDMVYLRKQLEVQREGDKQRVDILLKTEESGIPYAEEITYPKNWREIIEKPTRQPEKPIGLDPADVFVYEQLDQVVDLSQLSPTMPFSDAIDNHRDKYGRDTVSSLRHGIREPAKSCRRRICRDWLRC